MSRLDELLKFANTSEKGLEIAPYFNPALPKRLGYDVLILDVFDTETLRKQAATDPLISADRLVEIEEVDVVGDASRIGEAAEREGLTGQLHYIVSSHNFEHLPNPILFLQGCTDALAPGGVLSMAVPDCRACFDHFRMPTRLIDWLTAFHRNATQPSAETIFDAKSMAADYLRGSDRFPGCDLNNESPEGFEPIGNLKECYETYLTQLETLGDYKDAHCSVFFPETMTLLLNDLRHIGLLELEVLEVSQTVGHEFFVHLKKSEQAARLSDEEFYAARKKTLRAMASRLGRAGFPGARRHASDLKPASNASSKLPFGLIAFHRRFKAKFAELVGEQRYGKFRRWNRDRRMRRRARRANKRP